MKLENILDLMCYGDKIDIRRDGHQKPLYKGEVKDIYNDLLNCEVVQIWSRENEMTIFIK